MNPPERGWCETPLSESQARAEVERHGSIKEAAAAYGVHRSTFSYWLNRDVHKQRMRRYYAAHTERKLAQVREWYFQMGSVQYNERLLKLRRYKGLRRMSKRGEASRWPATGPRMK